MNRRLYLANAILWAAVIVASAIAGAAPFLTLLLLPSLAVSALMVTLPGTRRADCPRSVTD